MPPKKRDKETDSSKNSRADLVQADHELFLQAFEKPTQIYRFLRSRSLLCPLFLNRTLSYMKSRMSRSNKGRKQFQINKMLERKLQSQGENVPQPLPGFMTLTFLGVFDKKGESHEDPVVVETLLLKVCHKKRKDVSCPIQTKSLGTNFIAYNPSEGSPPPKVPALSIPLECFSLTEGNQVKSYHLQLRVGFTNGLPVPNGDLDSEPALKKRKTLKCDGEGDVGWHQYGHDLIIYDKQNRCQLTDGYYELVLDALQPGAKMSQTLSTWTYVPLGKEEDSDPMGPFESFNNGPTIKFHLRWSREAIGKLVDRPKPVSQMVDDMLDNNSNKENDRPEKSEEQAEKKLQIVYQFLYNNNSRQQTEACEDLHCPWCSLDCTGLYSLLKHLKLCHPRFTFTYVPIHRGARIDVAINEAYDGSYSGSPQDLITGEGYSRNGPVRRTQMSNILVCNPKRPQPTLSEFLELDENEFDGQRPYITGHNRLYHHTTTCLPIYPKEMDVDSEDENDPKWLQTKTMMMIDEFTDVNEGEKELMKSWNLHVMKHGYVGDCQIPLACSMFVQAKGQEILKKNLYRNFVLHMSNLFDFGLVSAVTVYTTIQRLQELVEEGGDESKVLEQSCQAQRVHWAAEGATRALEARRVASPAQPPTNTGPAERRKPTNNGQPKTPAQSEALKKRSLYTSQADTAQQPPAKKKLSVSGKPTAANDKDKKKPPEKAAEKNDNVAKKKSSNGGLVLVPKPVSQSTAAKEKEEPERSMKMRRKSTVEPSKKPEPAEAVVVLRRKSCPPGATAAPDTRKRTLENGTTHGSGVS